MGRIRFSSSLARTGLRRRLLLTASLCFSGLSSLLSDSLLLTMSGLIEMLKLFDRLRLRLCVRLPDRLRERLSTGDRLRRPASGRSLRLGLLSCSVFDELFFLLSAGLTAVGGDTLPGEEGLDPVAGLDSPLNADVPPVARV